MEIGDKLYPEKMKAQCDSAIQILEKDNLAIEQVQKHLQDFILDDELVSESYSALKLQISDYLAVTSAMITANELDLEDLKTLKASIGNRILLGDVILPNMDSAREDIIRYEEAASEYARKAAGVFIFSSIRNYYLELAAYYELRALLARARYAFWESQNNTFDEINTSTRNLMAQGSGFREAARQGMESITKSFQDGVYCIDLNAPWRAALGSENSKRMEQLKAQFLKKTEDGKTEYDWKKIEKWLKQDAEEVSDLEYLAFIDLMSGMSNEELQDLFSKGQISVSWLDDTHANISKVLQEASERYLCIAQIEAELTIFDEHSKYIYDEKKVANQLSKAFLVYQILECVEKNGAGYRHHIFISSEIEDGVITYIADVPIWDAAGGLGEAIADYKDRRIIKVNTWGDNKRVQGVLNDCERVTFYGLDASAGDLLGKAGGGYAAEYILGKIGKMTVEKVGSTLANTLTVANLLVDIQENYENSVAISGALNIIDLREQVDALGIQAGVINVTGVDESSVQFICPKYDPEELRIRVEAYNSAREGEINTGLITVEDLKSSFENGGEVLEDYVHWYYKEGGATDIVEYWDELEKIAIGYRAQNPGAIGETVRNLSVDQLQELINKKNDPSYEINPEVMKGIE